MRTQLDDEFLLATEIGRCTIEPIPATGSGEAQDKKERTPRE